MSRAMPLGYVGPWPNYGPCPRCGQIVARTYAGVVFHKHRGSAKCRKASEKQAKR
jgi:hypothetical protein